MTLTSFVCATFMVVLCRSPSPVDADEACSHRLHSRGVSSRRFWLKIHPKRSLTASGGGRDSSSAIGFAGSAPIGWASRPGPTTFSRSLACSGVSETIKFWELGLSSFKEWLTLRRVPSLDDFLRVILQSSEEAGSGLKERSGLQGGEVRVLKAPLTSSRCKPRTPISDVGVM